MKSLLKIAIVAVLLAGAIFRLAHLHDDRALTPNERIYVYYASRIQDEGLAANRALFNEYANDPAMWAQAPPVRIGYTYLLKLAMQAMGTETAEAGMALSLAASILTLLLIAWIGCRFFNPWISLVASALCATSLTELWLTRGTPEDGVFGLSALLELWMSCEMMRARRRWWLYIPFHAIGIWSILVKQSGLFVYAFCIAWLIGFLILRERSFRRAIILMCSAVAAVAAACAIVAWTAGDSHLAWRVNELAIRTNDESWGYQEECCTGPWYEMPLAFLLVSPATFVLSVIAIVALSWRSSLSTLQRNYAAVCALMAFGFAAIFTFLPKMQTLRYTTPADGAICLVAGVGLWWIVEMVPYRVFAALAMAGLLANMAREYQVFNRIAVPRGIPELGAEQIRYAFEADPVRQAEADAAWNTLRVNISQRIAAHPTPEWYWGVSVQLMNGQRYPECAAAAQKALDLFPRYTKAYNVQSTCYLNSGNYPLAAQAARAALVLEPGYRAALDNLRIAMTASPPRQPVSAAALLNASVDDYRARDLQGCIDRAREALRFDPALATAWNNIAACSNDLGRSDDGIKAATQALRLQPDFQLAKNNLAVAVNQKRAMELAPQ